MRDEQRLEAVLGQFAEDGVEEERHVVVNDLDDGDGLRGCAGRGRKEADFRRMRRTLDDPLPRLGGEIGELRRIVVRYVFRRRPRVKLPDERRLCVARTAGQKLLGGGEEPMRSVVLRDRYR